MPVAGIFHEKLKIHHASHAGICCCYLEDRSIQPSMKISGVDNGELVIHVRIVFETAPCSMLESIIK